MAACSSVKENKNVFVQPDYTETDAQNVEIGRIQELIRTDSLAALWRCILLEQNTQEIPRIRQQCIDSVLADYNRYIEERDYASARKVLVSLDAAGISAGTAAKTSMELGELMTAAVPPLAEKNIGTAYDGKVSSLIRGTVTVWVDKGLKIEGGMGYADGVIGSGFFIDRKGTIITNHHVISDVVDPKHEGIARLYVRLADDPDSKIPAKVIGWDEVLDMALLKVEIDSPFVFTLGSSTDLDVGDRIYAIGSPIGLERTLTSGIVSATDRMLFTIGTVLQIDAAVNSGNSGGPLVAQNGAVQGIVFAGISQYSGLNFVIPVEYLKNELAFLYRGGKVEHSWIGAYGRTKRSAGRNAGLEVQYVMPGSSAHRAGLSAGDIITAINGEPIMQLEDMQNALMKQMPGTLAQVTYRNADDEVQSALVYLAVRPKNPGYSVYQSDLLGNAFEPIFGMKLISVSSISSRKYSIKSILRGSIADTSSFSENDPIDVNKIEFNDNKSVVYTEIYTKKRKAGYLDVSIGLQAGLDSPYYF